jgi:hypothetical protein
MATTLPGPKYKAMRDKTKAAVDAHIAKLPAEEQAKARAMVDKFRAGEDKFFAKATERANMTPEQRKAAREAMVAKLETRIGKIKSRIEAGGGTAQPIEPPGGSTPTTPATPATPATPVATPRVRLTPEQRAERRAARAKSRADRGLGTMPIQRAVRRTLKGVKPYKIRRGWFS